MITFDEPQENGRDWLKKKKQRSQIMERDVLKANKPESIYKDEQQAPLKKENKPAEK